MEPLSVLVELHHIGPREAPASSFLHHLGNEALDLSPELHKVSLAAVAIGESPHEEQPVLFTEPSQLTPSPPSRLLPASVWVLGGLHLAAPVHLPAYPHHRDHGLAGVGTDRQSYVASTYGGFRWFFK